MRRHENSRELSRLGPDPWQMALIGLCALILCSCRAPAGHHRCETADASGQTLPAEAYTGVPPAAMAVAPMGPPVTSVSTLRV